MVVSFNDQFEIHITDPFLHLIRFSFFYLHALPQPVGESS